jgi:hypothetical protein
VTTIGPLAFGVPWILFGLIALPVIWWLLRVTPPAPKRVLFPAVRLLLGLQQKNLPARHCGLLLRTAIAGLAVWRLRSLSESAVRGPEEKPRRRRCRQRLGGCCSLG